jgi:hypothetical protein
MYRFTFNWSIYYSSIIISRGLHVSCYTTPILAACQFFNFYLLLMCDIIFTHMSWAASSYFAKCFCDVYSEYITPCAIMIYATPDAMRVMPLRLCTLLICERLHMVELDDYNILHLEHLVRSKQSRVHDLFSVQNLIISRLRMFKC